MPIFDFRFQVEAPLEDVRDFHRDTRALTLLTPPPTIIRIHSVEPLAEGSVSRFTLWVGPLPLRWTAVHRDVSELGFTDIQEEGPAAKWKHTHSFTPLSPVATEIHEHIEYEHKPGLAGLVTRILFAKPNLLFMFAYRRWITRRHLAAGRKDARGIAEPHRPPSASDRTTGGHRNGE